ncbi:heterokaryon incompatibility protein-domain-containing protein [Alternaria rosae]|uniref:heterokaryon incompatibility protein-domain-containing protein n=1 Tax=Alternaria rosae TaxID=1187941 RepID=UPI001E8E7756|nr:heterokaryon incompatibility protein-domain-containing protein [Alternaria rosae]KAH6882009.1 heterokaryon incompatibility protein-domain-containing protein [Alternaria rosae]
MCDGSRSLRKIHGQCTWQVPFRHQIPESRRSHCWGDGEGIIRTTVTNFHDHSDEGIPVSILPATFRDAAKICQILGIFYLWIDSLCIIQDSDEDWRDQSAKMADIYANAFLTIAASASENSSKGFFRTPDPKFVEEPLPGYPGVYVRLTTDSEDDTWPLLRRAWVFQELVLSPRVVHFGPNEVIWQCQQAVESQSRQSNWVLSRSIGELMTINRTTKILQSENPDLTYAWHQMVELYSKRRLTYSKDRLPAIAAIAKIMQSLRQDDEYTAGIWRSSLCIDILWHGPRMRAPWTGNQLAAVKRRMAGSIPTWSWASTSTHVTWMGAHEVLSTVEVLEVRYAVHGPTVSGRVIEAAITIRCPRLRFCDIRHQADGQIPLKDAIYESLSATSSEMAHDDPRWDDVGRGRGHDIPTQLYLLFLTLNHGPYKRSGGQWALIVMETDQPGRYVRLGVVEMHYAGWWTIWHRQDEIEYVTNKDVDELMEEYNTRFIDMLKEMDTQVVTLL